MTTTPEPTKGVPRLEGNPSPTLRADYNDIADWVRDHTGEYVPATENLPSTGNWTGRTIRVGKLNYVYMGSASGWIRQEMHSGGLFYDAVAADGTTQIQHGLGVTPTDVQITAMNHPSNDSISKYFQPVLFNPPTSTRFNVRLLDRRTNDWASGPQQYRFMWHAFAASPSGGV